ncbi:MAG: GTP cyclohydrolase II [Alphaproteobacteria bacterium]|nr:MAG: GTP cyclohydrolase II [Alphaproteobacteria bacterium]
MLRILLSNAQGATAQILPVATGRGIVSIQQNQASSTRFQTIRRIRHALADLRLGWPVRVQLSDEHGFLILPADALAEGSRWQEGIRAAGRSPDESCQLWLTPQRAQVLHVPHKGRALVALALGPDWRPEEVLALADPTRDLALPWKGPYERVTYPETVDVPAGGLFALLREAGRLPAVLAWQEEEIRASKEGEAILTLTPDHLTFPHRPESGMAEIARARLPLANAPHTRIAVFRTDDGGPEHFALLVGDPLPHEAVLVRVHSECFTGDHLGSLKCDCGDQLQAALARLAAEKTGGVLLYLAQEGRGIGLVAKLKAYALQDQGFDTIEANERLGFAAEHRNFAIAAAMLRHLGFARIRLLTNNPDKVAQLERAGITVTERVPLRMPARPENARYLATKRRKAGHDL